MAKLFDPQVFMAANAAPGKYVFEQDAEGKVFVIKLPDNEDDDMALWAYPQTPQRQKLAA